MLFKEFYVGCHGGHIGYQTENRTNDRGLDKDLDQWVFHPLLFNLMSILLHI